MSDPIRQVFTNLDRWRHLPSYQLERRLDIFLTPYLREIVEAHVREPLAETMIPEMPLKKPDGNRTHKADYVLFARDGRAVFLVELKTDCASVRGEQDEYLLRAGQRPWRDTLQDLKEVVAASGHRRKYIHLLEVLRRAGQVRLAPEVTACFDAGATGGTRFRPEWVTVVAEVERVETVFLTPVAIDGRRCITFGAVREHLATRDDTFAPLLAEHLARWECAAGSTAPGE